MYERNTNTVHPEIRHFYDMEREDALKRGGKKKKAKRVATNINENKINVKVMVGGDNKKKARPEFANYKAITKTSRLVTPNMEFANPPRVQQPSYFAVPNGVGLWDNRESLQGSRHSPEKVVRETVPAGSAPNPAQVPNRQGIEPVSSHAQRAIPTSHSSGGVFASNPINLAESFEKMEPHVGAHVQYFPPTGRDNRPPPRQAQEDAPRADFIPLYGMRPETREEEQLRESRADIPPIRGVKMDSEYKIRTKATDLGSIKQKLDVSQVPEQVRTRPSGAYVVKPHQRERVAEERHTYEDVSNKRHGGIVHSVF